MMAEQVYDICIVGAGVIGSAAARHASAKPPLKVCLLGPYEPKDKLACGHGIFSSHYDEGRIVRLDSDRKSSKAILCANTIGRFKQLEINSGISFYTPVGSVVIGQKGSSYMDKIIQSELLNTDLRRLDYQQAMQTFPYVNFTENDECIYETEMCGYVNPRKLVKAELAVACMHGCDSIHDVVNDVINTNQSDGSVLYKVVTMSHGTVYARNIILATGAFTLLRNLLPPDVVPDMESHARFVVMGEVTKEEANKLNDMPPMHHQVISYEAKDYGYTPGVYWCYVCPPIQYPNGKFYIKLGLRMAVGIALTTEQEMKDWFTKDMPQDILEDAKTWLIAMFPGVNFVSFEYAPCVSTVTPSGLPYVDIVAPHFGVALAGNGYGVTIGDEVGRLIVDLVTTGTWQEDKMPREAFRFQAKKQ